MSPLAPRNPIFLICCIQAFMLSVPNYVMSLLGILDQDPLLKMLIGEDNERFIAMTTPGITKDIYELALASVALWAFGYYRIYMDGASCQPLVLCLGGIGRINAALLLLRWYMDGNVKVALVLVGSVPDLILGSYCIYVWSLMGFTFQASAAVTTTTTKAD